MSETQETATLGGGCFWCLEAVFKDLRGVSWVMSGYAAGHVANPTYKAVCSGRTGALISSAFTKKRATRSVACAPLPIQ